MYGIEIIFVMYGRGGNGLYIISMVLKKSPRVWEKIHEIRKKTYKSDVAGEACRGS